MQTNLDRFIANLSCDTCPARLFCTVKSPIGSCKEILTEWAQTGRCADCKYCNKGLAANQCDKNRFIVNENDSCPKWEGKE